MNETEFKKKWKSEKPIYQAWGEYVVDFIKNELKEKGKDLESFLKIPVKCRLKEDDSIVDKAFYRNKDYSDPYSQIEDKVGARFIVLLLDDIKEICEIVADAEWNIDPCKHFEEDKRNDPLLFTYQSVHFILRPKDEFKIKDITIPVSTSCELQIRTLLQHAHAEITHDAIYKSKRTVQPEVHRTVAKSMALIETTDEFFISVTKQLNHGPLEEHCIMKRLDNLYNTFTGLKSHTLKSSIVIWDEYERFIDENLVDKIQIMLKKHAFLSNTIKEKYTENAFYQQSTVLFLYWMLENKKRRLLSDWPFQKGLLEPFAIDIGITTWND
jgi:ppGpp synthetase/RelA/SpoT-type nucleotidyltranferase